MSAEPEISAARDTILLTGATGYVGSRLLPLLVATGRPVRLLVRDPARLGQRVPAGARVVVGDLEHTDSLAAALQGVEAAYDLVHSMDRADDFAAADRRAARDFAAAARTAGVRRIIYSEAATRLGICCARKACRSSSSEPRSSSGRAACRSR